MMCLTGRMTALYAFSSGFQPITRNQTNQPIKQTKNPSLFMIRKAPNTYVPFSGAIVVFVCYSYILFCIV